MKIGIVKENLKGEARVAATPETVKKMVALNHSVFIEKNAGLGASISDDEYKNNGAEIVTRDKVLQSDLLLMVRPLDTEEINTLNSDQYMVGMLEPFNSKLQAQINDQGVNAFALESFQE